MARHETGSIRVGIGGWTYEPWRETFYPPKLPKARELEHASRHLTSIEVNGTFYRSQKPETFAKWRDETPDDFVFALKAPRFATNRRVLAEAGDSVARFFDSGVGELGPKLGPINWQFAATKAFDANDFEAFLNLLPKEVDGRPLRHVVEVRHDSFRVPAFVDLLRRYGVAVVIACDSAYPQIADVTASFVYVRAMGTVETEPAGYAADDLDRWAQRARAWAAGGAPDDLETVADAAGKTPRDVFVYFISGHKALNPAAAMAMIERLG
ncbi:DUF72 domain-containing protein [Amorphus orientalis]|uniref:Uncharacterized protein YecE (DUF72 family) n=1 Tax=Amorphus orientalis TaxID=649198 RepID=A0AAE4AV11_9HYPH|nr:DUF72 domain-containing protein [Amorphus orientalis]MDQ0316259.1 uncharacterized protein YecE (DUF72 family) [Amorphus orientalis]